MITKSTMKFRAYNHDQDKDAIRQIWREIGWLTKEKREEDALDLFLTAGHTTVAEVNGKPECLVVSMPGTIRYLKQELPFSALAGVVTSRIARKRGLASRLTAHVVAHEAAQGALACGLGMFEQGYYNQLGFGTGCYDHWYSFDPAQLKVSLIPRMPDRLTADDWKMVHASRLARHRGHGACNLTAPENTLLEMFCGSNGFGLGYHDGPHGELAHHIWCWTKDVEHGPYNISWMCYETREQFIELLAVIKSLGDQIRLVKVREPQGIQLQDLLHQPLKNRQVTKDSKYENQLHAAAYWQLRICHLTECLKQTHLKGEELRFNLVLADPIEQFLDEDTPWNGIAGNYVITLGEESQAYPGKDKHLPTLQASVNAFSRLWLGVRPAIGLAFTDDIVGPPSLLRDLDQVISLPDPNPDWDF